MSVRMTIRIPIRMLIRMLIRMAIRMPPPAQQPPGRGRRQHPRPEHAHSLVMQESSSLIFRDFIAWEMPAVVAAL
jgi:hypothetical protein